MLFDPENEIKPLFRSQQNAKDNANVNVPLDEEVPVSLVSLLLPGTFEACTKFPKIRLKIEFGLKMLRPDVKLVIALFSFCRLHNAFCSAVNKLSQLFSCITKQTYEKWQEPFMLSAP